MYDYYDCEMCSGNRCFFKNLTRFAECHKARHGKNVKKKDGK